MKDIFLTSSALILAILLIRLLFRRSISRRVQYALWALVALRLLIPVSLPALDLNVLTAARPVSQAVTATLEQPLSPSDGAPATPQTAQPTADPGGTPVPAKAIYTENDQTYILKLIDEDAVWSD